MKITKITQQAKQRDRYSVFVDDVYSFSLSESALLQSGLVSGQELSREQITGYKQLSAHDKLYNRALRYAAMRPRSIWELQFYLQRKGADVPLIERIIDALIRIGILDDDKFAESFVHDRRLLRSQSTRRLKLELQKKHVSSEIIDRVLREDDTDEQSLLRALVDKKRKQAKYANDETKLMQYLARQGFSYSDIKSAMHKYDED